MPKLSIIVPTRERSDTLAHTIRTLVSQDYQDCEIVISDNASQDNTKEVVHSFSDARIRYINTGQRVSMSDNWEFALGKARGEFVTYLGDDDGFIPGAITNAMRLMEERPVDALVWDKVQYNWPVHGIEGMGNWFSLRVGDSHVYMAGGRSKLATLLKFRDGFAYERLPCLYCGIVGRPLIEEVKESSTNGMFFNSISPDIFSAIALGMVADRYLHSEYPFSIAGSSHHSTGVSFGAGKIGELSSAAGKFISENSRQYDPRVKLAPAVETALMGEYLHARQFLPKFKYPEPPWDHYVRSLIRRARGHERGDEILQSASHTVKLLGLKIKVPDRVEPNRRSHLAPGMQGDIFKFRAPVEMVSNIYDACQLVAGMVPNPSQGDARKSSIRFIRNMSRCFISEAKSLYRSF